jgi:hypothetical protein
MPTYPIEAGDSEAIANGLNYVLSGPSGLGQNFQGFSAYSAAPFPGAATTSFLTGNYRPPFTQPTEALLYVPFIDYNYGEMLDGQTWKFTFVSAQASPPYSLGQPLEITDSTDPYYDGRYTIGVVECTTTYVILRSAGIFTVVAPTTFGTINWFNTGATDNDGNPRYSSTDCNAKVTVTGASDRVFVAAQLNNVISYETDAAPFDFYYFVNINRYIGSPNNDPTNPEFVFNFDKVVSQKYYNFPALTGTGSLADIETIFASVIDEPDPGYYWYILEVWTGTPDEGNCNVTSMELNLRSLSAQVVKQ